jgi:glycosyltransferase involved in cell wall biosynthesis
MTESHAPSRILILSPFPPVPITNGGSERTSVLYSNLNSSADVLMLWPEHGKWDGMAQVPGGALQISISLEIDVQEKIDAYRSKWGLVAWGSGLGTFICESEVFKAKVALYAEGVDTIILSHPWLVDALPKTFSGRVIYDAHNYETELIKSQIGDVLDKSSQKWIEVFVNELIKDIQDVEERAVRRAETTICVSDYDMSKFKINYPLSNFILIPSGFSVTPTLPPRARKLNEMLFFGSSHPPNISAAEHIIALAKKFPTLSFVIAGDVCSFLKVDCENIRLLGRISERELDELLATATVFLNPITSGAGISLKLIRAMSSGIPILSTPLGARGFLARKEEVVFLSELKDFEKALTELLRVPNLRTQLASKAKELVDHNYTWKSLSKNFNEYVAGSHNSAIKFYEAQEFLSHGVLKWYSSGRFEKYTIDEPGLNLPPLPYNFLKTISKKLIPNRFHQEIGKIYRGFTKSR